MLEVPLSDELAEELEAVSADQGRAREEMVAEAINRRVRGERLERALQSPELVRLYAELAHEDVELAEAGMADYAVLLAESDRHEAR